jgi:excinuclease ABC subunit C
LNKQERKNLIPSLVSKLEALPKEPGVYLMKDARNKIIYVGKAKSLKSRVNSYFHASAAHSPKTVAMVDLIRDFEIMLVDSEVGALLLERTLIKHHKPFFNIRLQDDKEYPYVRIDFNSPWPRVRKVRKRKNDGATYIGPFGNVLYLNTMLQLANRIFPLIKCSSHEFENAKRPCNYFHMRMCLGPCTIEIPRDLYIEAVKGAVAFLQGKNRELIKDLSNKMKEASAREEYESAATYRDQIEAFKHVTEQKTVVVSDIKDCDIIGYSQKSDIASIHILLIREGLVTSRDNFLINIPVQSREEALQEFLLQYYDNKFVPEEICIPFEIPDMTSMEELLPQIEDTRKTLNITIPQRGTKKRLIEMAEKNAIFSLEESFRHIQSKVVALELLQAKIGLDRFPKTIECIDISNIQGTAIVASDVCFVDGKPAKDLYRLYNLSDQAENPDDFACIREVMIRRLNRARVEGDLPDLFVIDGGKGQLSAALSATAEFPDLDTRVVSLAKSRMQKGDEQADHPQKGRRPKFSAASFESESVIHSNERIFLPGSEDGIELDVGSPEYRIITHLRDEAHRFAITHHRKRRKKVLHSSVLETIPGIGPSMRKKLFDLFTDLNGLKTATFEQLKAVPGLRESAATALFSYFRKEEEEDA